MAARRPATFTSCIAYAALALAACACLAGGDELGDALERARELRPAIERAEAAADTAYAAAARRIKAQYSERVATAEAELRERHGAHGEARGEFESESDYADRIEAYRAGLPAFIAAWTPVHASVERERDAALAKARVDADKSTGAAKLRAELTAIEEKGFLVEVETRVGAYRTEDGAFPVMLSHSRWPVPSDATLAMPVEDAERTKPKLGAATVKYGIKDGEAARLAMWIGKDKHPLRAAEWTRVHRLSGHVGRVTGAVFVGHSRVLTSGLDGRLVLWDRGTGEQIRAIEAHSMPGSFLRLVVNGRHVVSATHREIKIWDARTLAPFATIAGDDLIPPAAGDAAGRAVSQVSAVALGRSPSRLAYGLHLPVGALAHGLNPPVSAVVLWDADGEAAAAVIKGTGALAGSGALVKSLAFSPSGEYLAGGLLDGRVVLWQVRERAPGTADNPGRARHRRSPDAWRDCEPRELRSIAAHDKRVSALAFTPDGARLVSGSGDRTAKLWDVASGELVRTFPNGHSEALTSVAVHPNGKRLVTGSADSTPRLWDLDSGRLIRGYQGRNAAVASVALGRVDLLTASADGSARLWKMGTGSSQRAFRGHLTEAWISRLSEDGRRLLTGGRDGVTRLWNLDAGAQVRAVMSSDRMAGGMAMNSDGRYIAMPTDNGVVRLFGGRDGRNMGEFASSYGGIVRVQFVNGGRQYLITAAGIAAELRLVENPDKVRRILDPTREGDGGPTGWFGALSGDGSTLLTVSSVEKAHLWEAETGKPKGAVTVVGDPTRAKPPSINHDGSRLLTYALRDRARLWDAETGAEFPEVAAATEGCRAAAFSNDGRLLITGSNTRHTVAPSGAIQIVQSCGIVKLWSAETGALIRDLPTQPNPVAHVGFSGDDSRVMVRSGPAVRVYEVTSGTEVASLTPSTRYVSAAALSYDGTTVVTIASNGLIDVWRPVAVAASEMTR